MKSIYEINRQINYYDNLLEVINKALVPINKIPDVLQRADNGIKENYTINDSSADDRKIITIKNGVDDTIINLKNKVIPAIHSKLESLRRDRERLEAELW